MPFNIRPVIIIYILKKNVYIEIKLKRNGQNVSKKNLNLGFNYTGFKEQ